MSCDKDYFPISQHLMKDFWKPGVLIFDFGPNSTQKILKLSKK